MISVVAPVYRNADTLVELAGRVRAVAQDLGVDHELILVNDASPDSTEEVISGLVERDAAIGGVDLANNVGQYRAVMAGLHHCRGDWVIILDADLQDPPEAIPALLERARTGFDGVFAGRDGRYQVCHRMITSRLYKTVQHRVSAVPRDAGMFMVLSRRMVEQLLAMPGSDGLSVVMRVGLTGLPCTSVPVRRDARPRGESAYPSWRRWHLGVRNVFGALQWRWWPKWRQPPNSPPVVKQRLGVCAAPPGIGG